MVRPGLYILGSLVRLSLARHFFQLDCTFLEQALSISQMARSTLRYLALLQLASLALAQNDCVLTVPPNPLSAQGLATPYTQTGCDQRQFADQASFVEAAIWDPATTSYSLYAPLVVNKGDVAGKNFIAPVVPVLPANATVALWFGTNGGTLTLAGTGAQQAGCVNGLNQNGALSIFGQVGNTIDLPVLTCVVRLLQRAGLLCSRSGSHNKWRSRFTASRECQRRYTMSSDKRLSHRGYGSRRQRREHVLTSPERHASAKHTR